MKNILFGVAAGAAVLTFANVDAATPAAPAAELSRGQAQFRRCQSCHSIAPTGPSTIGPKLNGIVGRTAGTLPGYIRYTPAMKNSRITWTPEKLDAFLTSPRAVVPGTSMVFAGLPDPAARKALIAYLAQTR